MIARLIKPKTASHKCSHLLCDKKPEFINEKGKIISNTTCLSIITASNSGKTKVWSYYCRPCIDKLYRDLKPLLDSKFWIYA